MVAFVLLIIAFGFRSVSGNSQVEIDQPLTRSGGFDVASSQQNENPFKFGFLVAIQRKDGSDSKQLENQNQLKKFKPIHGIEMIKEGTRREQPDIALDNLEDDDLANRRLLLEYKGPFQVAPNSKIPLVDCRRSNIEVLEETVQAEEPQNSLFLKKDVLDIENEKLPTKLEPEDLSEFGNGRRFDVSPGPRAAEKSYPKEQTSETNLAPADETSKQDKKDCNDKKQTNNQRAYDELVDPFMEYNYRKSNNENHNERITNEKQNSKSSPKIDDVQVESRTGYQQKVMLIENTRVCYACSTAGNPNCLVPNRRTTVKYCHKGHDTCITKIYETKEATILTRDCGSSCSESALPGIAPQYSKCSVCHEDLCNGAFSLNKQNLIFIWSMFFVAVIKSVL